MPIRRPVAAALVLGLLAALLAAFGLRAAGGDTPLAASAALREEAREELAELTAPSDYLLARQSFGSDRGADPAQFMRTARADVAQMDVTAAEWQLTGPTNIGGRILDLALDPDDPRRVYAATASGGVWVTDDATKVTDDATTDSEEGVRMELRWPDDLPQAIGAIAMTKSGVLFAGTGETGPGGGSMSYGGDGMYRSRDRGLTWEHIGLRDSQRISRIMVDPQDESRIFVAASGPLYKPGGERGIYLSEDGGDTWTRVLEGANATTGGTDIAIDAKNPQRVYAALWDHLREPDKRRYNGPGSGLFRSDDGGKTWERIAPQFAAVPTLGRIGIGLSESDPNVIYVNASTESGAYGGMYKSTDGGDTWTPIAHPLVAASQMVYGWWFARIWVDPKDPDHVFVAGLNLVESSDGGVNWRNVGGVHVDQHAMAFDTRLENRVYLGNDGGFYRSDSNGSRDWEFATYQPYSQLYGLDVSEQNPDRQVAGLQDNGVNRSYRSGDDAAPDNWSSYGGGDGERTLIKPTDQDFLYGCSQYGSCFTKRGGGSNQSFDHKVVSSRKNWFTPIEFDPENPSVVYTGGEILSKSRNDAGDWTPISPELSNGPGRELNPLFKNFGTLTTIAPAPEATGTIYAGTDDGNLWYTHTGGGVAPNAWTKASDPDLPKAWITRVEVDPADEMTAYVTYSGFRQGDDAAYVLRTEDGGANWDDISGNLPNAPVNDINVIGDDLVVATDLGVFRSTDTGATWTRLGSNLPLTSITELRYHEGTNQLFVSTFGRSMYKVAYPAG